MIKQNFYSNGSRQGNAQQLEATQAVHTGNGVSGVVAVVGNLADAQLGFRSELIKDMVAAGYKVLLFASDFDHKTRARTQALGAEAIDYPMSRTGLNPFNDLYCTWVLYRLFKRHKVTVSFCSFAKPVVWGTLAAWLAKVPKRIAKIEGLGRNFVVPPEGVKFKQRLVRRVLLGLYAISLPKAHTVYVLNPDDKHDLTVTYGLKIKNIDVLGGIGVCLGHYAYTRPPTDKLRFIFVGRLLSEKGIHYYLQAAEQIKETHPEVEFIVLGQPDGKHGVSRSELLHYVRRGVITYPGQVDNVVEWLTSSSVFVLPSYYREGVPRSTQEAMAVGRAIITTDMPGCRETVQHAVNGYLIAPYSASELDAAMQLFVNDPDKAARMGCESRRLAEMSFNVRHINSKILKTIECKEPMESLTQ